MPTKKVILSGKSFKSIVDAVTKFPGIGGFGGSEMVNLVSRGGGLIASNLGIALSWIRVQAEGSLDLVSMDERSLIPFAALCSDHCKVGVFSDGKLVRIRARGREVSGAWQQGTAFKRPEENGRALAMTAEMAQRIGYLSNVAMADQSRPELACVMLTDGMAMACNQRTVAVLKCEGTIATEKTAIALPLAKILKEGDTIYVSAKQTVAHCGEAWYGMPSPVQAQKEFPVASIKRFSTAEAQRLFVIKGGLLAQAADECNTCLVQIARMDISVELTVREDGNLVFAAENGGTKFQTVMPLLRADQKDVSVRVPLDELLHISGFVSQADRVVVGLGSKRQVFMTFADGWVMLPAWKG